MTAAISTSFFFLEHDEKWKDEKPFRVLFNPPPGLAKSNLNLLKIEGINVSDVRESETDFTIEKNGFMLINIDSCSMKPEEFDDEAKVAKHFLPQISNAVMKTLGASRVQFFDTTVSVQLTCHDVADLAQVRRRHAQFPLHIGESYTHLQPTSIVHIDTTEADAEGILFKLNPKEAGRLTTRKWQWFNVWVPLKGPVRDYPLALLDISTLDAAEDLVHQDTVNADVVHETYQVYNSSRHRWYYAKDQMPCEAWLFIQATSGDESPPGVPHSSFDYPWKTEQDPLRESIECRGFAFYDT